MLILACRSQLSFNCVASLNAAASRIFNDHIFPAFLQLHRLSVDFRFKFRSSSSCFSLIAPIFLPTLVTWSLHSPAVPRVGRCSRPAARISPCMPRTHTGSSERAFFFCRTRAVEQSSHTTAKLASHVQSLGVIWDLILSISSLSLPMLRADVVSVSGAILIFVALYSAQICCMTEPNLTYNASTSSKLSTHSFVTPTSSLASRQLFVVYFIEWK